VAQRACDVGLLRVVDGQRPKATWRAVLAIEIHDLFLRRVEATGEVAVVDPDPEIVRTEVLRRSARQRRVSRDR